MKTKTQTGTIGLNSGELPLKANFVRITLRLLIAIGLASGLTASKAGAGEWVQWPASSGGNGHWYKAVLTNAITPRIASELAQRDGGYLATITSAEENAFVFSLVNSPFFFTPLNGSGPVLGGRQQEGAPEPAGGWYWVTGEPWNYTNWSQESPNNGNGGPFEDTLQFFSNTPRTPAPTWNDLSADDPNCGGYVAERPGSNQPPTMFSQPIGQTNFVGETVQLNVFATGSWPLTYQWHKDGATIDGATNSTLVLSDVTVAATGDYTVVVSNDFGSLTSAVARVTVTERPWPYFENFEGAVGQEWSRRQTDVTPVGNRRFLGQFGSETVSLNLSGLPVHQGVTVTFDLFVLNTWDGNYSEAGVGPDVWDLSVAGGATLLHTTFLLYPHGTPVTQAFPGQFPGGNFPARTGATEQNTLGSSYGMDSVYHLTFTFPHTADVITLNFSGTGLQDLSDESWGLDNVKVSLSPIAPETALRVNSSLASGGTWLATNNLPVSGVSVSGTRALVQLGDSGVRLLSLTNPAAPVALGSWNTFLPLSDAMLVGNLGYIASWEPGFLSTVEIVDFTDPARPALRGFYDTPGYAMDLAVRGNIAYVADAEGGLLILNVEDPAWPWRLGGYDTRGSVNRVEVSGRYAYISDGNWLVTLDVSDPANPRRVGLYEVASGISSLKAAGTKLYLSEGTGDVRILSMTNSANAQLLGTYRGWGSPAQAMAASGRFLYLAKGIGGLHVLDVSDPAKPAYLTGAWSSPAEDVALMGNYTLVAGGDKGMTVYQLRQHLEPPLRPPVISNGMMTLTWPALAGVRLQMATNLVRPFWQDMAESEGTNILNLPMTNRAAFFRLAMGPKQTRPPGMVAWWPGDGNALDLVGTNHGTLMNGATFVPGKVGQAFQFDGVGAHVRIPDSPSLRPTCFTIEGWFNWVRLDSGIIVSKGLFDSYNSFALAWNNRSVGPALWVVSHPDELSVLWTPVWGQWHHLAWTHGGQDQQLGLYIDGLEVASGMAIASIRYDETPLVIGADHDFGMPAHFSSGAVDELSLYNRALTADEIKAIYDAGSAGKLKPPR